MFKTKKSAFPIPEGTGTNNIRRDVFKRSARIAAVALSIGTMVPSCVLADRAILEPALDREIAFLLERNFTLPLVLDSAAQSRVDQLDDVVAAEVARLTALLRSRGFLEARIETSGTVTDDDPLRLRPVTGRLYRFGEIRMNGLPPRPDAALDDAVVALRAGPVGGPALRSVADDVGRRLLFELREASFADAVLRDVAFDLDEQTGIADLVLTVDPGLPKRFGKVQFRGSLRMDEVEMQAMVPFKPGQPYSITSIDALRRALTETGNFRRIRIETEAVPGAREVVDVSVQLRDAAPRTLETAPPRILLAAIAFLIVIQTIRMTPLWSDRDVRMLFIIPALLVLTGSALEVIDRLSWLLHH